MYTVPTLKYHTVCSVFLKHAVHTVQYIVVAKATKAPFVRPRVPNTILWPGLQILCCLHLVVFSVHFLMLFDQFSV